MPTFTDDQLANIQGVGIAGFRKDHQRFLFVRFRDSTTGTALLRAVTDRIASASEVGQFNALFSAIRRRTGEDPSVKATWTGLLVSSAGYAKLGVNLDAELPASDGSVAFKAGMAARSAFIGDTRSKDAPSQWKPEFRPPERIDAVLVVAADDPEDLDETAIRLSDAITDAGCELVGNFRGATLEGAMRGHEHFGNKDGISQPAIVGYGNAPAVGEPDAVPAGEFVLGYPDQNGAPATVGDLWNDGSFVVYRLLLQDVVAYRKQLAAGVPGADPAISSEVLGAKLVGRWPSGASLAMNPELDPGLGHEDNAFNYKASPVNDDLGLITPRFAHIRKAFPRDETTPDPIGDDPRRHRMIRRGIPFGEAMLEGDSGADTGERGLHFVCFVSDLARQFEFVQQNWLNNANFPNGQVTTPGQGYQPPTTEPPDGPDPIVGEHDDASPVAFHQLGGVRPLPILTEVVTNAGGEYFFCPSISAITKLAGGATASTVVAPPAAATTAAPPSPQAAPPSNPAVG